MCTRPDGVATRFARCPRARPQVEELLNANIFASSALKVTKAIFGTIDADKSGDVSLNELVKVVFPAGGPEVRAGILRYINWSLRRDRELEHARSQKGGGIGSPPSSARSALASPLPPAAAAKAPPAAAAGSPAPPQQRGKVVVDDAAAQKVEAARAARLARQAAAAGGSKAEPPEGGEEA